MQNQEKIIQAIAAKLNEYDTLVSLYDVEEMAQSIAAAIAPHLEAAPKKCGSCGVNESRLLHACP